MRSQDFPPRLLKREGKEAGGSSLKLRVAGTPCSSLKLLLPARHRYFLLVTKTAPRWYSLMMMMMMTMFFCLLGCRDAQRGGACRACRCVSSACSSSAKRSQHSRRAKTPGTPRSSRSASAAGTLESAYHLRRRAGKTELLPKRLDFYVAGFRCQAFSPARYFNAKSRPSFCECPLGDVPGRLRPFCQ